MSAHRYEEGAISSRTNHSLAHNNNITHAHTSKYKGISEITLDVIRKGNKTRNTVHYKPLISSSAHNYDMHSKHCLSPSFCALP